MQDTKRLKMDKYLELFLIIPIIIQMIWLSKNFLLPVADSGGHFMTTCQIFKAFQQSFSQGVYFAFHDGGKPILFSHFMAPFLLFSKTDVRLIFNISVCTLYTFLIISYYSLFQALKISRLFSVLMTVFIVTIPYFFNLFVSFMPETLWNIAFILCLNFLIRSENLTIRKHTIFASLSFAICFLARPIESCVVLPNIVLLYFVYLCMELKKDSFSLSNIFLSLGLGIFTLAFCFKMSWAQSSNLGLLVLCSYVLISLFRIFVSAKSVDNAQSLKYKNFIQIECFLMPIFIMLSMWMLYYGKPLFDWGYDNSFGNGAKANDQVFYRENIFLILWTLVKKYGVYGIVGTFVLACMTSFISNTNNKQWRYLLVANICIMLPMLTLYSLSGTSDPRRLMLPMIFGIVSLCIYIYFNTQSRPFFRKLSALFFSICLMFQIIFCIDMCYTTKHKKFDTLLQSLKLPTFNYLPPMIYKSKDLMIIKKLDELKIPPEKIAVFSLGMFTNKVLFQAESLKYFNLLLGQHYNFSTHWAYSDYEPYDEVLHKLELAGFSYILLENVSNPFSDPTTAARMRSHTYFIEDTLKKIEEYGEAHLPGLILISKIKIAGRVIYIYQLDIKYLRDLLKITASSQLNDYGPQGLLRFSPPGWHSENNPTYPQYLNLEFKTKIDISKIILSPQQGDKRLLPRFAKKVVFFSSLDGIIWKTIYKNDNLCNYPKTDDGFIILELDKLISLKFLKVKILENCGDPSLLTIQGLTFK